MTEAKQIYNRDLRQVQYIGEDGSMVIDGRLSAQEAYDKMYERLLIDTGESEADEWQENWCSSPDDLTIGWFHLVTPEEQHKFDTDTEWYISTRKESPYVVWMYQA